MSRRAVLTFGFLLAVAAPAGADDAADAKALVEKAVKAQGGQDKLAKFPAHTITFKGKFHGMGAAIDMSGEITTQSHDKVKVDIEVDAGGMKFRVVNVFNGDKGWVRIGDETKEMTKDELAEAKLQAHSGWVTTLAPLADKAFTLATVGEIKIDGKTALGVKVSRKGHRDIDLYFDKESGLLVKTESRVKDDAGQEVMEESFLGDYKDVKGTKQAMKFTIKRDGKLFLEGEISDYQLSEKLDDSVFAKP